MHNESMSARNDSHEDTENVEKSCRSPTYATLHLLPDLYTLTAYILLLFSEVSVPSVAVVSGGGIFPPRGLKRFP